MVVVIGLMFAPIYYCFFSWAIKRYDLQTPGRGSTKLFTKKDFQAQQLNKNGTVTTTVVQSTSSVPTKDDRIQDIIEALGGSSNIVTVEACFTRLRTELKDPGKANKDWLISLGAKGVMLQGSQGYHVIFGTEADVLKNKIKSRLAGED
jgi:glucose-like phosphotransferase system IIB component